MEKFYKNFVNYMFKKTITRWEIGTVWLILYILGNHYMEVPFKFEEGYEGVIVAMCIWLLSAIISGFGEEAEKDLNGDQDE